MRTDFENLVDGQRILLIPAAGNLLHEFPVIATYQTGYFYCDGSPPEEGPDYFLSTDIPLCIEGFDDA